MPHCKHCTYNIGMWGNQRHTSSSLGFHGLGQPLRKGPLCVGGHRVLTQVHLEQALHQGRGGNGASLGGWVGGLGSCVRRTMEGGESWLLHSVGSSASVLQWLAIDRPSQPCSHSLSMPLDPCHFEARAAVPHLHAVYICIQLRPGGGEGHLRAPVEALALKLRRKGRQGGGVPSLGEVIGRAPWIS